MIAVALLVLCCILPAFGDEPPTGQHFYPQGAHGTTVCIEIRPAGHHSPTKVCGPVVHGGMQPQQQVPQPPQQKQRVESGTGEGIQRTLDPSMLQMQGEPKEAPPPCSRGYPRMPMFVPRSVGDGLVAMGMPVDGETMGWRQASPPCPPDHAMRAIIPPPMLPFQAFPPAMRTWLAPGFRSAEETEQAPKITESKEDFEHLLKECDEKTKIIREKEREIADLKGKMTAEPKKETDKQTNGKPQMVQTQMKN